MKTIELDMPTRVILEGMLGSQRGTLDSLAVPHDILNKIKLSDSDREPFMITLRGTTTIDQDALKAATGTVSLTVDLEKEEVRVLAKLSKTWEHFGQGDYVYVSALVKVLEA